MGWRTLWRSVAFWGAALIISVPLLAIPLHAIGAEPTFVHPGLLHGQGDLNRIRAQLATQAEPWSSGLRCLQQHDQSRADWRLRGPFAVVTRDPKGTRHNHEMVLDGNAAYQNALLWCLTGDEAHAQKSREILNAWSRTLTRIDGHDAPLAAGLNGFKLVNAAELLRHTFPQWTAEDSARMERFCREVLAPPINNFAPYANGNWDAACLKTMLAIGVFCDDRPTFERAVAYFREGEGNGRLTHFVVNPTGQCQESGRDQQHTQLGLGCLAEACEIAWQQGVDLYAESDDRLLRGFEYTAKYNLGQDVPFTRHRDVTGKYVHAAISSEGRGELRPIYEMVWNHYAQRRQRAAPYCAQAAAKLRPEGAAFASDHPGFGTLLFSLEPSQPSK